jgi:O-antigen ligase
MPAVGEILVAISVFVLGGLASGLRANLMMLLVVTFASLVIHLATGIWLRWAALPLVGIGVGGLVLQQATWFVAAAFARPAVPVRATRPVGDARRETGGRP